MNMFSNKYMTIFSCFQTSPDSSEKSFIIHEKSQDILF